MRVNLIVTGLGLGPAENTQRVIDPNVLRDVSISFRTYDVSPDGQRFLVIKGAPGEDTAASPPQVIVVQNWVEA